MVCTASGPCHVAGTCDPSTGVCSNPAAPDGAACNDANACTQTDTCQSGACTGSNPVVCTASDACHDAGTCDPGTGQCSNPPKPNGVACNDANACTQTDTCQSGACTGSNPVVCTASDQCHDAGTCNPATGQCSNPSKPDGTACDDGDPCTVDACSGGVCHGTPVPAPAEVDGGVRLSRSGSATVIAWNLAVGATSSDVLRGLVSALPVGPGGADELCLADGLTATSTMDSGVPAARVAFWYLVRGENACGKGPYGFQARNGVQTVSQVSTTCP